MQYGWSHVYWMTIEGIPFLPCERALSKTVPIGFGSEVATLVVDNSARVGAVIDRNTGMSAYMTRQTVVRYLQSAVNSTNPVLTLDDVSGLTSPVWLGRECVTFSGTAGATLDPCTRGVAGYALPAPNRQQRQHGHKRAALLAWAAGHAVRAADRPDGLCAWHGVG
jgi:hypothetical protein